MVDEIQVPVPDQNHRPKPSFPMLQLYIADDDLWKKKLCPELMKKK